ncbi:MAG: amidase [Paracoccaceae bacterium]|nr:amidase [Paracoccaceae bacterium]
MTEATAFLGISALGAGYREGRFTPREVVETALARLDRLEPRLNAFADPMADAARADADRATAALAKGQELGPLHGIPVAVKDLIEVKGAPTGYGTKVEPPHVATEDAALVARLRAAGAVILGKTNLLEYAYGVAHPEIGQTNNPHDPTRTAGGSSGGSAAAVAAGIVPLAVGTDTGGSIRIPAAYCGIVGMKPSFGLVPLEGVFPLAQSLDHAGPLARSVADAAILLSCLADRPMPLDRPVRPLRLGLIGAHVSRTELGNAVSSHVETWLDRLRRDGLIELVAVEIAGLEQANADLMALLVPEAALIHAERLARNPGGYAPGTRAQLEAGGSVTAMDYLRAKARQTRLTAAVEAALDGLDALISPSVPFVAPVEDPVIVDGADSEMLASGFANLTGHPSLSLPFGAIDGLPVGVQLTGRLGGDARLLSVAAQLQDFLGPGCAVQPTPL